MKLSIIFTIVRLKKLSKLFSKLNQILISGPPQLISTIMSYIPKLSDNLSVNSDKLKIIDIIIEAFEQRVEAQDAYEKSLMRIAQKFGSANTNIPVFGITAGELSKSHAQRAFQINTYKEQLKVDLSHLKKMNKDMFMEIQNKNKAYKKMEKDFRLGIEKVEKAKQVALISKRDLDQKIILNQIGKLNLDINQVERKKLFDAGTKLTAEQKQIQATYFSSISQMVDAIKLFNSSTEGINKQIASISEKLLVEFYDFLKKYSIHEVNYLRNTQYDLNVWIKKIEVRQSQTIEQSKVQPLAQFLDQREVDGWQETRLSLVTETFEDVQQDESFNQQIQSKFQKAVQANYITEFLQEMTKNYKQMKSTIGKCIQNYRLKNKFKFDEEECKNLSKIFVKLSQLAYNNKDLDFMQRILLFSMTYYRLQNNEKRFIIQDIKSNKFFSQLDFWRFFCYFSLRSTISNFKKKQIKDSNQSSLHQKNAVYSSLLTIATNMINFGIEKHTTRNFIAKAAKTFPLTEFQVTEIIRFIDSQNIKVEKKISK